MIGKVRVIGAPDGPGTSKRKAIILDGADDKENVRKAIGSPARKKAKRRLRQKQFASLRSCR